jgi:hypothetical protein
VLCCAVLCAVRVEGGGSSWAGTMGLDIETSVW